MLVGTGRQAILAALEDLQLRSHVGRLLIPTYFCEEVADWLAARTQIERYSCAPFEPHVDIETRSDDAVLIVEYFGQRSQVNFGEGVAIVDRTHMPWASYNYDFEVGAIAGSLRKAFPVADGGFVRLPEGRSHPREFRLRPEHNSDARELRRAMESKSRWLQRQGTSTEKEEFLQRHRLAEERISVGEVSRITQESYELVKAVSTSALDDARRGNIARLGASLSGTLSSVELIETPSFVVLRCRSEGERDRLRTALIRRDVYPAVLWPLRPEAPVEHQDLSRRIVQLHADFRYSLDEMALLADAVEGAWSEVARG